MNANKILREEILARLRELLEKNKKRRIFIGYDKIGRARYKMKK